MLQGKGIYLPEYQKGNGFSEGIKAFAEKSGLSNAASKILRTALKPLSDKLNMIVKGGGLILTGKTQDAHADRIESLLQGKGIYLPNYVKGNGFIDDIKAFAEKAGLSCAASKVLRTALKSLSNELQIIIKGDTLILTGK